MTKPLCGVRPSLTAILPYRNPIDVGGLEVQETLIVAELPEAYGVHAVRAYTVALALSAMTLPGRAALDPAALAAWEEEVLYQMPREEGIWAPLIVIASEMRDPAVARAEIIAQACMALSEWALTAEAAGAALLFGEAATFAMAGDARYAYVAGSLFKHYGRHTEAKRWLVHARRQAFSARDLEVQGLALAALKDLAV